MICTKIILTVEDIVHLAAFVGLADEKEMRAKVGQDQFETEISISGKIKNDEDTTHDTVVYDRYAWFYEYPEEGVYQLAKTNQWGEVHGNNKNKT